MGVVSQRIAELVARTATTTFEIDKNNLKSAHFILDITAGAGTAVAASATVTFAGVLAGDTVTINGLVYTAVAGAKANNTQFSIDGTDTVDAADLADSIVNDVRVGSEDYTATSDAAVLTVTSTTALPSDGNDITLVTSNGTRLAATGGGSLDGGVDLDTITLTFDAYDFASKTWYNLLTGVALDASATTIYRIGPDFTAAAGVAVVDIIPKRIRIIATKANASPVTYSIGVNGVE